MIRKQMNGIVWLEFALFAPFPQLVHGTFLRHGGVSTGPAATLDLGDRDKDNPQARVENQRRVLQIMQAEHLVFPYEVHGTQIVYVDQPPPKPPQCDALMTDKKGLALMSLHCDCQAAIFFDPKKQAIATVHCGWRGNVHNIYAKALQAMQERWDVAPEDVLVGIAPSLGPEKAEFVNYQKELPESFWPFQVKPLYFDFWRIAREQLEEAGVLPHHIEIASICNYSHPEDFFSYRRDRHITGNHGTLAMLTF
jgi:hypothetical protein